MAERDITYCVVELQHAFYFAKSKFEKEHPEKPQPFLTCTFRSNIEQDELYAQGRTKPGKIVTYLQGGKSKHNLGKAFDIAFKDKEGKLDWSLSLFKIFALYIHEFNSEIIWGGSWKSFKDNPHFEI